MRVDGAVSGGPDQSLTVDQRDVLSGFASEVLGQAEIDKMKIFSGLAESDDEIFWLDITMDYIFSVERLHSCNRLLGKH